MLWRVVSPCSLLLIGFLCSEWPLPDCLHRRRMQSLSKLSLSSQQAAQILDTYGDTILRYAYSYLHNQSDTEEVLQDTLIQFLKTRPVFESDEHEKAWLLRVAGNLCKNRLKYNSLRQTDELREELIAEQREDLSFIWDAVQALPVQYREVIHLFYREGYSTREISQILGRKEATIRSDLSRGRGKLKELLKEAYDFEV